MPHPAVRLGSATGPVTLDLTNGTSPGNDDSADATNVSSLLPFTDDLNTSYATNETGEAAGICTGTACRTVWYKLQGCARQWNVPRLHVRQRDGFRYRHRRLLRAAHRDDARRLR